MSSRKFNSRALVFTDSDLDGTASRLCFEYFQPNCTLIQSSASEIDGALHEDAVNAYDIIGFADLCASAETWVELRNKKQLWLWDHHPRAPEILESPNVHWDKARCSAQLVYDWFGDFGNPVLRRIIELTQVYDLWNYTHPDFRYALDLNNLIFWYKRQKFSRTHDRFLDLQMEKIRYWQEWGYLDEEQQAVKEEREKEAKILAKVRKGLVIKEDAEGRPYALFEVASKMSYISHMIQEELQDSVMYVCGKSTFEKERNKFSLRTRGETVMTEIAAKYGGGGHKQASGFVLTDEQYAAFLAGSLKL